jgi:hypothetical protein
MGPKYEHFKFACGDIVALKQMIEIEQNEPMMIVELLYQECPGGVQLHYSCRNFRFSNPVRYLENELAEYVAVDPSKKWSEVMDATASRAALRRELRAKENDTTGSAE